MLFVSSSIIDFNESENSLFNSVSFSAKTPKTKEPDKRITEITKTVNLFIE